MWASHTNLNILYHGAHSIFSSLLLLEVAHQILSFVFLKNIYAIEVCEQFCSVINPFLHYCHRRWRGWDVRDKVIDPIRLHGKRVIVTLYRWVQHGGTRASSCTFPHVGSFVLAFPLRTHITHILSVHMLICFKVRSSTVFQNLSRCFK